MAKVTLDALIEREDFEVEANPNPGKKKETISIEDIKADSFFFSNIRKPDFQRETNEWDSQRICELIKSFIEGDLIPAIILWRSTGGFLFVIDGSHRLSALSAWVNDDYGDGKISKLFYDGVIPDEQLKIAEETRKLIQKKVGSYNDFRLALTSPDEVKPEIVKAAKSLAALAIQNGLKVMPVKPKIPFSKSISKLPPLIKPSSNFLNPERNLIASQHAQ